MTELVNGKYAVEGILGKGAMATVSRAVHVATERKVVLKRPHKRLLHDRIILERFEREARAAGRIRSRHVVDILDVDRDAEGPYLVMEYLDGESLATRLARTPRLEASEVVSLVDQLLAGAGAAHRAGVIHRDLKPANVFLAREDGHDRVKILDFGISKVEEKSRSELTATGTLVGTIPYVSPEQIAGVAVGHQTDLWAIGIITYRCLAGVHAFHDDDDLRTLGQILHQEPAPLPTELPPEVIAAFTPFLRRALAKPLAERFATADEMRDALLGVRDALAPVVHAVPAPARGEATTVMTPQTPTHRDGIFAARPDLGLGAAACAFALVLGVYAGITSARGESPRTFAIDVAASDASVQIDGDAVVDPRRVAIPAGAAHAIEVGAPGFLTRTIPPPGRIGARLVVGLARVPATPVAATAVAPPAASASAAPSVPDLEDELPRAAPTRSPVVRPKPATAPPARSTIKPIARPPY